VLAALVGVLSELPTTGGRSRRRSPAHGAIPNCSWGSAAGKSAGHRDAGADTVANTGAAVAFESQRSNLRLPIVGATAAGGTARLPATGPRSVSHRGSNGRRASDTHGFRTCRALGIHIASSIARAATPGASAQFDTGSGAHFSGAFDVLDGAASSGCGRPPVAQPLAAAKIGLHPPASGIRGGGTNRGKRVRGALSKSPPVTGSFLRSLRSPGAPGCLSPSLRRGFQQSRSGATLRT
jgi:hypothetical protein